MYVSETDSNTYQCSASNILGSAARGTELFVVTTPKFFTKPPTKLEILTGDNMTLPAVLRAIQNQPSAGRGKEDRFSWREVTPHRIFTYSCIIKNIRLRYYSVSL